jgi:hypothetical protein
MSTYNPKQAIEKGGCHKMTLHPERGLVIKWVV